MCVLLAIVTSAAVDIPVRDSVWTCLRVLGVHSWWNCGLHITAFSLLWLSAVPTAAAALCQVRDSAVQAGVFPVLAMFAEATGYLPGSSVGWEGVGAQTRVCETSAATKLRTSSTPPAGCAPGSRLAQTRYSSDGIGHVFRPVTMGLTTSSVGLLSILAELRGHS